MPASSGQGGSRQGGYGYAAHTGLRLSGKKLESLGWKPRQTLADMYRDMIEDLAEQLK